MKGFYMRVIAGKARRHNLLAPSGLDVRPTTDRTKETLFNILNMSIYDANFLDLFSGSGAIGIEALSRGAQRTHFVESSKDALKCIEKNLENTRLKESALIYRTDVINALEELYNNNYKFDIIFMDPPYNKGWEERIVPLIQQYDLLRDQGIIICESSIETKYEFINSTNYIISKEKLFKTNKFTFLTK
jgi:16S rRNA (guanine966-N2)-methyltransferase